MGIGYRDYIRQKLKTFYIQKGKQSQAEFAKRLDVQPSFLTNVFKNRADFSSDQVYKISKILMLSKADSYYLELLHSRDRTGLLERKKELQSEIDKIEDGQLKTEKYLKKIHAPPEKSEGYYLNPFCVVIHVFLNFPKYAKNPNDLIDTLGISSEVLNECLRTLESLNYIKSTAKGFEVIVKGRHLPKESVLQTAYQTLFRYKSIDQLQRIDKKKSYSFSATFSCRESDKKAIHEEFLKFISTTEDIVKNSERESVYQIHFDLFPWSLTEK